MKPAYIPINDFIDWLQSLPSDTKIIHSSLSMVRSVEACVYCEDYVAYSSSNDEGCLFRTCSDWYFCSGFPGIENETYPRWECRLQDGKGPITMVIVSKKEVNHGSDS